MKRRFMYLAVIATLLAVGAGVRAQGGLTLEECRERALQSNNRMKIAGEKQLASDDMRRLALSEFFPKLSANGGYMCFSDSWSLLSGEQSKSLSSMGSTVVGELGADVAPLISNLVINQEISLQTAQQLQQMMQGGAMAGKLNGVGANLVDDLTIDTRNLFVGAVSVTQPIYLGGKLREMYRLAKQMNELAGLEYDKEREALLISVDDAYWQVVSLEHKRLLAEQYHALLKELSDNVDAMVEAEVATRGDQANVRVKLVEAEMNLTKATGGLRLAKMLLAQRCGMDLDADITLAADTALALHAPYASVAMDSVFSRRTEIRMLALAEEMASSSVRLAASALKPNVLASASYLLTYPNMQDGFALSTAGVWSAGVVVNIPLCHPDAIYGVKVAKHKRNEAALQLAEAKSMVELQVNKLNYELDVACKRMEQARSAQVHAEENLRLAQESFAAGLISSSDLMVAQTAWLQAKGEVIDADIELRMDYLYLRQAMGV